MLNPSSEDLDIVLFILEGAKGGKVWADPKEGLFIWAQLDFSYLNYFGWFGWFVPLIVVDGVIYECCLFIPLEGGL